MDYSYPLLEKIFNHYKKSDLDLSNFKLFSCQHLLGPQLEMYKYFIKFGLKSENIVVLGKAYSSNEGVISDLQSLGIKIFQPEFKGNSFDFEHAENCKAMIGLLSKGNKNIILDDGGFLINESKSKDVLFAVEQTSSGFRKLENSSFNFPIFNVARSKTKLTQESPIIGRLIFERIKDYISDHHINSTRIIIIGLGPIGNSLMQILSENNFDVSGFDIDTKRQDIITYIKDQKPDLVIGATGSSLFSESDLSDFDNEHKYHFISVSSSDREFPVVNFRKNNKVHDDIVYKNFTFVNNGFPITFKGNRYESTPIEIEKTISLLMGSVMYGLVSKIGDRKGIIEIPSELEDLINV